MKIRYFLKLYISIGFLLILLLPNSCKEKNPEDKAASEEKKLGYPVYPSYSEKDLAIPADFTPTERDTVMQSLHLYETQVWDAGKLSGQLLVAKGNEILLEKYSGYARVQPEVPNSKNVALHVASITKTLTALAVLKLVESGKINLQQDVRDFFPNFPYSGIKVEDLLSHRSGLPKYEHLLPTIPKTLPVLQKKYLSNQDILDILISIKPPLARPTRSGFMYCNTNFALLALIIEKVTEHPYPEVMKNMIFKPLGMNHSFIFTEKDLPTAAESFYNTGHRLYPLDQLDMIYGDKNLYTTARDLLQLSLALFRKDFLKNDLLEQAFLPRSNEKPGVKNYGYGFRLKIAPDGTKIIYHTGWWHGSNTIFVHMPKSKATIIALGNVYSNRYYTAMTLATLFENVNGLTSNLHQLIHEPKAKADSLSAE